MKMRVTVGAEAAPMCLQRSAPPDAVEDAPSLDPWLKATSGGRLATYGPGDGAACEVLVLDSEFSPWVAWVMVLWRRRELA